MKHYSRFLLPVIIISVSSCTCNSGNKTGRSNASDTLQIEFPSIIDSTELRRLEYEENIMYSNSVKGHDEREMIVGHFYEPERLDTLYIRQTARCECLPGDTICTYFLNSKVISEQEYLDDAQYYFDVRSPRMKAPLQIYGLCPKLVFEGDLDGNGTDEFGILSTWYASSCRWYYIYTWHEDSWRLLVEPIFNSHPLRTSGLEIARPGPRKGTVLINKTMDGTGCLSNQIIRDTVYMAGYFELDE